MRSRAPLVVVVVAAGWLAVIAGVGTGCGDLRGKLSAGGGANGAAGNAATGGRGAGGGAAAVGGRGAGTAGAGAVAAGGAGGGRGGAVGTGGGGGAPADGGVDRPDAPVSSGGTTGSGGAPTDGGGDVRDAPGTGGVGPGTGGAGTGGAGPGVGGASPGTGGAGGAAPTGAPNSTACTADKECLSGHCVDKVCCNDACTGQCEACDVPSLAGTCAYVMPGMQPRGTRTKCAGMGTTCGGQCDGKMRTVCAYPTSAISCRAQSCTMNTKTRAAVCDGKGACGAVETVPCAMGCSGTDCLGACTTDAECMAASASKPYCDGGTCTALRPNGHACTAATQCTSGHCADGFCCNSDCTDQCASCKETGSVGVCQTITDSVRVNSAGTLPNRTACSGSVAACMSTCDGQNKTCQFPGSSTACGAAASCASGMMTPAGTCNAAGGCTQTAFACPTGYCNGASCGACPNDTACGAGKWCDPSTASGTCRDKKPNGTTCTAGADNQCANGHCVADLSGNGVCCATGCSNPTPRCNAAGTACVCNATSCFSNTVCNAMTGACCTPAPCWRDNCRAQDCTPNCNLPVIPRNCGCTSTECCGGSSGVCCTSGSCSSGSCSATTSCSP